jgi:hypothetical protein
MGWDIENSGKGKNEINGRGYIRLKEKIEEDNGLW